MKIAAIAAGGLFLLLLAVALLLLTYGWTRLRYPLEARLSARLGRTVTIAGLRRLDHGLGTATLLLDDVRVAQPDWAGAGDFVRVAHATVRLPLLPLLHGAARPTSIDIDGLAIHLIRHADGNANWKGLPGGGRRSAGGGQGGLQHLAIRDGVLLFDDDKRDHHFRAGIRVEDAGLMVAGAGTLAGRPMRVRLAGPAPLGHDRWPFRLDYRSPIANAILGGVMDRPLDLGHWSAGVHAWGDDLKHLDLLVEAGLPGTQPVDLTATIRHDRPDWRIDALTAAIGRSRIAGVLSVRKTGERTVLAGHVVAPGLDFDDLSNAEGRARAAALHAAAPDRRLPATRIDLSHLLKLDGRIAVDIRHLLFRKPSAFRSMRGTLVLDHGLLTLAPFQVGLASGTLGGQMTVRQRGAASILSLDLRLGGSRIEAIATDASAFSGALSGRFVLTGRGPTIRAALGTSDGRFAIVGRDGTLGRQVALLLGQDVGRGALARAGEVARLRCGIGSFVVHGGKARPAPLLIDTSVTRAEATGLVDLADERVDLSLTGQPKQPSVLRLSGPIRVTGPLFAPHVAAPEATSTRGILRSIGRAIRGGGGPLAGDADCAGLAAHALR